MFWKIPPFAILFTTVLIDMIGFGIVIPTLPFYAEKLGGDGFAVGLLLALFSLGMLLAAPLWGMVSDRFGRRRPLLLSLFGGAIFYALLGIADSLLLLFIFRFFAGLMAGNLTIANAYLSDITAPHERTRKMGTLGIAFGLGFVIGPALGAFASHFGLMAPALAAGGLTALNFFFVLFGLPEPSRHNQEKVKAKVREVVHKALLILFLAGCLGMLAFSAMQSMYALSVQQRFGWGPKEIGYAMTYIGFMVIFFRVALFNPLVRLLSERKLLISGLLMIALGLALFPWSTNPIFFVLLTTLFPFGMGALNAPLMSLSSREADPRHRGFVLGLTNTALSLGSVVGPMIAGALFDLGGTPLTFLSAAGLAVCAAVISLFYRPSALALAAEKNPN